MSSPYIPIRTLAQLSGVSAHTLRFYEAEGILKPAARGENGHRRYLPSDIQWLEFVLRLKQTGMPLAEIRQYAALRAEGETTVPARLTMLELHRRRLLCKIDELSICAEALDEKMRVYRAMLARTSAPTDKVEE